MNLTEELLALARERQADVQEKKGVVSLKFLVAERKAFLSKKKLHYTFKFFVDEAGKAVRYEDMLAESGLGMSGGDLDSGPGFGFKTETYRVGMGQPREGAVQEQSVLFGQKYTYTFDFAQFRGEVERRAAAAGCRLVFGLK